jgi:hypothetical protein
MNFKLAITSALFASTFALVAGCAADAAPDEAETEEGATSQDELNAYGAKFVGAYHGTDSAHPPRFEGLVFSVDGTFFGDVDTGIRCIMAPCPSSVHLEGRYSATKNYLRLSPKKGASAEADGYYGRYRYTLAGDNLSLSNKNLGETWSNTFAKKTSYCAQASDCDGQGLIVPACMGAFTCGAGVGAQSANSCGWKCGAFPPPPSNAIWPATATKLVAQGSGGFMAPPPAGSTCEYSQKYSLERATGVLSWEECEGPGGKPLHMNTGSKTLTPAEVEAVNQAMNQVTVAADPQCGADKPYLQLKVTSPAGEKTYVDSFYQCNGGTVTYIDGIDGVFGALRDAAK